MTRDLLKKLVIGGAIILSAAAALGQQNDKKNIRDPFVPPKNIRYIARQEQKIVQSLDELVKRLDKDGFDSKKVQAAYSDSRFIVHREIIRLFDGSPEKKGAKGVITYNHYKRNLGLEDKLARAPDFMRKYKKELAAAENKYGVDKRYIVAIIGIESDFGSNGGHYYTFNALTSMYTTNLKGFAYNEIKEYLKMCATNKSDLFGYKGSYAGAMGYAQWISSSYNKLFVDGNGDSKRDPFCMEDCIASVGNYLKENGWNPKANGKAPGENSRNWKSIRSYNNSNFYVRAVIELATKAKWHVSDLRAEPGAITDF